MRNSLRAMLPGEESPRGLGARPRPLLSAATDVEDEFAYRQTFGRLEIRLSG